MRTCQRLFQRGQVRQAIQELDCALQNTDDIGVHHSLLTALAQQFIDMIDHDRRDVPQELIPVLESGGADGGGLKACLGKCLGIGRAIRGMNQGGWWIPTEKFFLEPRLRDMLMALSDPASAIEVIHQQVALHFDTPQLLVDPDDFKLLLNRLEQMHRLARTSMDSVPLSCVLGHAQELFQRLAEKTDDAFAALKQPCLRLIEACLTPDALRARYGIRSRIELGVQVNADTGQWNWKKVAYPTTSQLTNENSTHESFKFFSDIDRLLQGPRPVPWNWVVNAVIAALKKHHWVPDYGVWLSWSLREARRGNMDPMVQQLIKIQEELGTHEARKQLFLRLTEHIKAGMPWHEKTAITDAVLARHELGWGISANDEWELRELCAHGGDAAPMIELLKSQLPQDFVHAKRLAALLALCQGARLKPADAITLIRALRPHLDNAPELRESFDELFHSLSGRASAPDEPLIPTTSDALVRRAREALGAWLTIDTRQAPRVVVHTSRAKAPVSAEDKERFEAALFTWMNVELLQESLSWPQLLSCIDEIEHSWKHTIDRDRLLQVCIQHVERTGNPKALQDHLPKLNETQPSDETLRELLAIAGRSAWNPHIRAVLLSHLLAWARQTPDFTLHIAFVEAVLALPAGDIRAQVADRFVAAHGGGEPMQQLFGALALLQEQPAPALEVTLSKLPHPPADRGAWPGWRALCAVLWKGIAERLVTPLGQDATQENTGEQLLEALTNLATPTPNNMALAIPHLFDLLGDLAQTIPDKQQRLDFLNGLHAYSLQWPGAPLLQAAVRGILQAFIAQESGNAFSLPPASNTNQFVIDGAVPLFTRGVLYWMALQRGETVSAETHQHELKLRWDRSELKTHAPEAAQLIARLFALHS